MNKKVLMIGAGLTLGSALLVTSAFADLGGARGYEAYKSAVRSTAAIDSATHRITVSLQDNGEERLNVETTVKGSEAAGAASGQVTIAGDDVAETIRFYNQDDQTVIVPGREDIYYVIADDGGAKRDRHDHHGEMDTAVSKELERVIDTLVGNLKNEVYVTEQSGGGKTAEMVLTGSRIPASVNVIGSFIVKESLSGSYHDDEDEWDASDLDPRELGIDFDRIAAHFPKLQQDVNIDRVALQAEIDANNIIEAHSLDLTISGKDEGGRTHKVVVSIDMEMSDVNATTADTIDLTGKNVKIIEE